MLTTLWLAAQMTKMLDLLDSYLDQLGHKAVRIDGSIAWQDRQVRSLCLCAQELDVPQ